MCSYILPCWCLFQEKESGPRYAGTAPYQSQVNAVHSFIIGTYFLTPLFVFLVSDWYTLFACKKWLSTKSWIKNHLAIFGIVANNIAPDVDWRLTTMCDSCNARHQSLTRSSHPHRLTYDLIHTHTYTYVASERALSVFENGPCPRASRVLSLFSTLF